MTSFSAPVSAPEMEEAVIALPFGRMALRCSAEQVVHLDYLAPDARLVPPATPLGRELAAQLLAYCGNPGHRFDLPLASAGTMFQNRVWALLQRIPPGQTLTYGEAADRLGSAARAVGQACGANPFAPIVPCHRIVARGGLGGFAHSTQSDGHLLHIKRWLLLHEGAGSDG
ncbi:methylated-DNA--protein-cysteine methyltransferase [mine drainage metagenome]|uniref:Methylated-DNA--protein-cysteine methyltransferase n=1 Tax=mine drainage metagenome TaxID=410659 RepID=A0A1J5PRZ4_9ZZZZ